MKRVALKRRKSLRDYCRDKVKTEGTAYRWNRTGKLKVRKPLKKVSRSKRKALSQYYPLNDEFLARPENKFCLICIVRREHGENILIQLATEVHHWGSRNGRLLCYVPWFRPSCRSCREWPHAHPKQAREMGLLAPASIWGVYPEDRN